MAKDYYGSFGAVSDAKSGASGPALPSQNLRVNPDMFGMNVAQAEGKRAATLGDIGDEGMKQATKYAAIDTEAKANDDIAKNYEPRRIELRNAYDALEGQDKVHGYETYIKNLTALNDEFVGSSSSQYERQLKGDFASRRLISEQETASRELVAAQKELSIQASAARISNDMLYGAAHYNDPALVQQSWESIEGAITLGSIDQGLDPSLPDDAAAINETIREAKGQFADRLIGSALTRGDALAANDLYAQYQRSLPGFQQEKIETVLHTENLRQAGTNGAKAMMTGQPLPQATGWPPASVQATVADAWHDDGMDPNEGLALAQVESAMGTITGVRGTIGQDKESKGQPIEVQVATMRKNWKEAKATARTKLGREPAGWEAYAVYQQGIGGGPALLNASTTSPTAKAVDVLAPLYKNRGTAAEAITANGGNLSMTAGDFLDVIKGKYERAMRVAAIGGAVSAPAPQATPEGVATIAAPAESVKPGARILAAYNQTGESVQPAATPMKALQSFENKLPAMLQRIQQIPNVSVRKAVENQMAAQQGVLKAAADAYKTQVTAQVQQYQYDEDFTSMDQVPADLQATLKTEFPKEYQDLRLAANKNRGADPASQVASSELYAQVNNLFDTRTKKDGSIRVTMKEQGLPDAVRLQDKIMTASDNGTISADDAKSMIKTIQINMGALAAGDKVKVDGDTHYESAYKSFVKSGATPTEVNRMFRDYVVLSDKFKFDELYSGDQGVINSLMNSITGWNKETEEGQSPEKVTQMILGAQAKQRYAGLTMLPNEPNAVIGRDGSSMTMSAAEPKGPADTTIKLTAKRMKDRESGAEAIVYYNPDGTVSHFTEL